MCLGLMSTNNNEVFCIESIHVWHTQMRNAPCIKYSPIVHLIYFLINLPPTEFLKMPVSFYLENIFWQKQEIVPFPVDIGSRSKSMEVGVGRLGNWGCILRIKLRACRYWKKLFLGSENLSTSCWKDAKTSSIYKSLNIIRPYVAHWEKSGPSMMVEKQSLTL